MTDIRNDNRSNRSKKKTSPLAAMAAVAAAFALLFGGYVLTRQNKKTEIDSIILLDVNPSISLSVDTEEVVQAVEARNDDARDVLGTMNLTGTSLEVSVNALIGAMMQKGYLDDMHNSILVSVENKDAARSAQLQQKVSQAISDAMHTDTMDAAVLSQNVDPDDDALAQLAQTYNISMGKAALIQEIMAQDPTLTFEKLAPMSINDIALIASSKQLTSQTVTQTGTASDKAYIGGDTALEKALAHAGVATADAKRVHVEFDSEDGRMVYEVEFETADLEYNYDIDASTGEAVKHEVESRYDDDDRYDDDNDHVDHNGGQPAGLPATGQTTAPTETPAAPATEAPAYIGEGAALSAAVAHAGINETDLREQEVHLDEDDGRMVYEVEWKSGSIEYDYEIDALTGQILKAEKDVDD